MGKPDSPLLPLTTLPRYLHAREFNAWHHPICPAASLPVGTHCSAQWKPSKPWFNDCERNAVNWRPAVLAYSWLTAVCFGQSLLWVTGQTGKLCVLSELVKMQTEKLGLKLVLVQLKYLTSVILCYANWSFTQKGTFSTIIYPPFSFYDHQMESISAPVVLSHPAHTPVKLKE